MSEEIIDVPVDNTERIRTLNDELRHNLAGGRVVLTDGILALAPHELASVIRQVQGFKDFSQDNDPHHEHDFGAFDCAGQKIFWKIDYYDKECCMGSDNPADPQQTTRVLTILLASEY